MEIKMNKDSTENQGVMYNSEKYVAEGICHFNKNGHCEVFSDTKCNALNNRCSFYKTSFQYIEDLNNAVKINREKGNCNKCRYMNTPCKCSYEKK